MEKVNVKKSQIGKQKSSEMKYDKFTLIWNRVKMVCPPSSKALWWFWAMSWIIWMFSLKHYWKSHSPGRDLDPYSRSPEVNQVPYGLREVCSPSFRAGGPGILSVLNPGWTALEEGLCCVDFTDRPLLIIPLGPSMSVLPPGIVPCGSTDSLLRDPSERRGQLSSCTEALETPPRRLLMASSEHLIELHAARPRAPWLGLSNLCALDRVLGEVVLHREQKCSKRFRVSSVNPYSKTVCGCCFPMQLGSS